MDTMVEYRVVGGESLFERIEHQSGENCIYRRRERPGRKLGAEKRRIAREELQRFYHTDAFMQLPRKVQLALTVLCPSGGKLR